MLNSNTRAKSPGDKEGLLNAYKIFQFEFVVTILHEIGHVFVSYLCKGLDDTPPDSPSEEGESGFHLEKLVFGGLLRIRRDTRSKDRHYGVCPSTMASIQGQLFRVIDV